MRHHSGILPVCFLTAAAAVVSHGTALAAKPVEHLTAFAVDMSNLAARTRAGTIDIVINRWSSDEERDRLLSALRESGTDGLLRALQKIKEPAGYIRTPPGLVPLPPINPQTVASAAARFVSAMPAPFPVTRA